MNSILRPDPDGREKHEHPREAMENALFRFRRWRRLAVGSGIAFAASCLSVWPFLAGYPLHSYWDPVGEGLVYVSMGLLVAFLYCALLLWGAWGFLRGLP